MEKMDFIILSASGRYMMLININQPLLLISATRKDHNRASGLWGFVIMFSKVIEFGDTAFIVLRKQELKFIHYYHHVVTAVSWWYMYPFYEPAQMWYVVMNSFVHSLMYPYFALRVNFSYCYILSTKHFLFFIFTFLGNEN